MTRRRLAATALTFVGLVLLFLTGVLLADGTRALISSTVNTGLTLAAAACLAAAFFWAPPPTTTAGPYRRFTPLVCALMFIAVPALAGGLLSALALPPGLPATALGALLGHAGIVLAVLWLGRDAGPRPRAVLGPLPRSSSAWATLALTIPLVMITWGESALTLNLSALFTPEPTRAELGEALVSASTQEVLRTPLGLLAIIVTGPAVEELVFRGLLLPHLRERRGAVVAVLGSALVFALIHLNTISAISTLVMGGVTALVYLRTGALVLPVLIHGLHNLASALLVTLPQLQPTSLEQIQLWLLPGVVLLLGALLWLWLALRPLSAAVPTRSFEAGGGS